MSEDAAPSAPSPQGGAYQRLKRVLSRPRADRTICVISLLLIAFSLDTGLSADDYIHAMIASGSAALPGFEHGPLDMFHFAGGEYTRALMKQGVLAWWDDPEAKLSFLRPVSAITHYFDHLLWPDKPWAMHVHSLVWTAFLFFGLLTLYRALVTPAWVCALAVALYALDDARGWFGSWIASRNAVVATAISIWVLVLHHRARLRDPKAGVFFAPLVLALALLSGEGAIAICGYLGAYAIFLDRGTWRERAWSLMPHVAVVLIWRVVYRKLGYGVANSGLYFDPGSDVFGFLAALVKRAPILLFSQVGGPWSDPYDAMFPFPVMQRLLMAAAVLCLGLLGYLLWPLLRRDPLVRFGLCGALLAVIPASAAFVADRLLSWVAIGASIVLARFIATYIDERPLLATSAQRAVWLRPVIFGLVFMKAVVEPIFLPSRARGNLILRDNLDRSVAAVTKEPWIAQKRVVYVNPPAVPFVAYLPIERAAQRVPRPEEQYWLAISETEVRVRRENERTLRVRQRGGFMQNPSSLLLRDPRRPFRLGATIELDGLQIEVVELTTDGRPAEILARFDRVLEDPSLLWLQWDGIGHKLWTPPKLGEQVTLPAADYVRAALGDAIVLPLDGRLPAPFDSHWD